MPDDPIYVDVGDEFDIEDNSWKYPDDLEHQDIIMEVFSVCGNRKYFHSKKEGRKWRKIDSQMSKGVVRPEWVRFCIDWAREKNASLCAIKVEALGNLILNKARMQDWLLENRNELRRPEDYL